MKISFPLSLKVSLWLLLNLVLLAAIGFGVLVAEGGIGLDSIMRGPAGRRFQDLGAVIVGEVAAAQPAARQAVLDRFGQAYHAEFFLYHMELPRPSVGLPEQVSALIAARPFGHPGGRGDMPGPPDRERGGPRERGFDPGRGGPPGFGGERGNGPSGGPPPLPPDGAPLDESRGRFLVHAGSPLAFWLGVREPWSAGRPERATLVARVSTTWGLIRLLDLEPWLLAAAAVVVFSVLFWLPFVHGITHHLRRLTAATEDIADGKFDTRVPAKRRDELGRLGESVNTMAARLDVLVNGQKRFLGDIAHELGSPLGRLQVATEILESRADPGLREQVADVREEVQQMASLVNELLAFTKAGLRPRDAELAPVAVNEVITQALDREGARDRVRLMLDPVPPVFADQELLGRAIGNLVRNALRYAGSGEAPVTISTRHAGAEVLLAVEDEGPGVPPEALPRLGEPFYRPESARSRETGGMGLGLAIVRSGVAACGGSVHFSNRSPHGFRAEIRLKASAVNPPPAEGSTFTSA